MKRPYLRRSMRPRLESLEGRALLSTLTQIGGVTSGAVTEDVALVATGTLTIARTNKYYFVPIAGTNGGQRSFRADAGATAHGRFSLGAAGAWAYTLDSGKAAVQALAAGDTLLDSFTARSFDGTRKVVTISIAGTNDAAVIGGMTSGAVTEDVALVATGTLTASDVDRGQDGFRADAGATAHGRFSLGAAGAWAYTLDSGKAAVQALAAGDTLLDSFTARSFDGTERVVTISTAGTNDVQVVDDGGPGFSATAGWRPSTGQGRGGTVLEAAPGTGSAVATWAFAVEPGRYRVSVTWSPHLNRSTNAPFSVSDGPTRLTAVTLDQRNLPGRFDDAGSPWEDLGPAVDVTGPTLFVRLTNKTATGRVVADAVRIERLADLGNTSHDPPAATALENALSRWRSNMIVRGQATADLIMSRDTDPAVKDQWVDIFYDSSWAFAEIARYTGDAKWFEPADRIAILYRDGYVRPNNGGVQGYYNFTRGLADHYRRTGDVKSREAVVMLANNMYAADSAKPATLASVALSREVAFALRAHLDAEALGEAHRPRTDLLATSILGHIDQWCEAPRTNPYFYVRPFMVGLSCESLIAYNEVHPDPRILPAIKRVLDRVWETCWVPGAAAFKYTDVVPPDNTGGVTPAPDLNLLIASSYAWVYRQTGDVAYRDKADAIFVGGVNGTVYWSSKHWTQQYRSSFEYVAWR